jgi:D-beta-D-heptose 7-phosphate kinase/D-beta-D-heptose 1-phosphate adenosyltransferase
MDLPEELANILRIRKRSRSQLTLVTGVFDVLHREHRRFLEAARKLSKILVIGLESDQRVRQMKGEGRPIHSAAERKANLQKWGLADVIFTLPSDFGQTSARQDLLQAIRPDYLAVSSHTPFLAVKKAELETIGGQVKVVYQFNPQVSSTKLIRKANNQAKKE